MLPNQNSHLQCIVNFVSTHVCTPRVKKPSTNSCGPGSCSLGSIFPDFLEYFSGFSRDSFRDFFLDSEHFSGFSSKNKWQHIFIFFRSHQYFSGFKVQFSTSKMSKNGGPVFSAVCGSKLIPISAPEPYKHRGCYRLLFFTNRALFLCPTYTHPIRSFQGMPNSKEIWIAPMRNPIWPLWTKSCMGHCKLVKTLKSECERQKRAPHSILCAHTVLGHWSEYQ